MYLDRFAYNIESSLSRASRIPVFGSLPACAKLLLATIQIVAGVALGFFSGLAAICSSSAREICKQSFCHIAHGFGNVCASVPEMIPVIGSIVYGLRGSIIIDPIPPSHMRGMGYLARTGQDDRFMAYAS